MSKGLTLLHYWEKLTPKQLRLIHDLLKANSSKRHNLNMGLLPFIPVKEIKLMLLRSPMSPWSDYLFNRLYSKEYWSDCAKTENRYMKSRQADMEEYGTILEVITQEPERKTQLGVLLDIWRERYGGE